MIYEAFRRFREERSGSPAFMVASGDRYVPISWRQFTDDIAAVVWAIGKYCPRAKIAILGENSYQWIVAHAACLLSGSCAVPLDVNLSVDEICERLKFVGAQTLAHSSLYGEKSIEVARRMPNLLRVGFSSLAADSFMEDGRTDEAFALWRGEGPTRTEADGSPTVSTIVFTSGTTSVPRGAELTLAAIESFALSGSRVIPMSASERSLMLLPLHHIFGISATYLMLVNGVALGVCPDFRRLYDAVNRFRADFVFLVPALADILAAKCERHGVRGLKWVLVGGAPISSRTDGRLAALGIRVLTGYGLTETAALFSLAPLDAPRTGSAGKVSPLDEVETKVSRDGELMVRGPNVMLGYYHEPEKTAEVLSSDGWFRTGDIGRIDADGYVWITGRAKRTIILSSGKKIAPEELEGKLLACPGISEAVVTGEAESRTITAEVYADIPEAEVRRAVAAINLSLPIYKRIKRVVVRDVPFPRTSSGKIRLPVAPPPVRQRPKSHHVLPVPRGWWLALALLGVVALALVVIAVCFIVYLGTD